MKKYFFSLLFLIQTGLLMAQEGLPPHLEGKMIYPIIDISPWVGVITIEPNALKYDPTIEYKVALDIYDKMRDSSAVNGALLEVARTFNLLVANGAPQEKVKVAAVIHAQSVLSILTDEAYKEKYGIPNPTLHLIAKLKEAGVELYVCGQNIGFYDIKPEQISPDVKIALSAKTALITLDQMGYSFLNVSGN
ncbi:MAG: DsrE family protein [Algoriphagus sp.]|nr:DsrE family protein [Algoriphagus sp.]